MTLKQSFLCLLLLLCLSACVLPPVAVPSPTAVPPTATPTKPAVTPPAAAYTPTPKPEIVTPDWSAQAILYEIFVRSFYDADGDGIGDLDGVAARLDYLQDLGVTAIWLLPIHPSPSYHGYDVTDYFAVNPDYGTRDSLVSLVDAAHQRGIQVILDLVVNHMADDHPFFQDAWGNADSRYADWFLWTNEDHTAYQAFGGYKDMPKLNHGNPEVVAYVSEIVRFWMDLDGDGDYTDGIDGFRCDVAKEVPPATWQKLRSDMRQLDADSFLLGEVWDGNALNLVDWYAEAFDALFDYPLYFDLAGSHDVSQDSLLAGVREPDMVGVTILAEEKLFPPGYQMVRFVNNHDNNRVMSDVGGDWARARLAATFYLTLPGTPMIYYGEEIGMKGEKGQGNPYWDEYRREPMDWYRAEEGLGMATWFRPEQRYNAPDDGISVEEQEHVAGSLLSHYRALTALRHAHPALRSGAFAQVGVQEGAGVYAYTRHSPPSESAPEEWFLVILNFSAESRSPGLELALAYEGPFTATDALSGTPWPDVPAGEPYRVTLPPASGVVLQLSRP